MPNAFVVKTADPSYPNYVAPGVFDWLQRGEARFGWSSEDEQDLRVIRTKVEMGQWEDLSAIQKDAWKGNGFLRRVNPGDYLLYPHQPRYGEFTVVRVVENGEYDYAPPEEANSDGDFRSRRKCVVVPGTPIDWNNRIVPPIIKHKLGLRGRFYQLYDIAEFQEMLQRLPDAGQEQRTFTNSIETIIARLIPQLPDIVRREFPAHKFSLFCHRLFRAMGYQSEYREGPMERGSDVLVTVQSVLFGEIHIGVQAFAYEGDISRTETEKKLSQLLQGWEQNFLNFGVLISTGDFDKSSRELIDEHNKTVGKPITLLDGKEVADLFLKHSSKFHFGESL